MAHHILVAKGEIYVISQSKWTSRIVTVLIVVGATAGAFFGAFYSSQYDKHNRDLKAINS